MIWKQLEKISSTSGVLEYLRKHKSYVPYDVDTMSPAFVDTGVWVDDSTDPMDFTGFRKIVVKLLVLIDEDLPATTYVKVSVRGKRGWIDTDAFDIAFCAAERSRVCVHGGST
jgi:hypothetical protein